MRATIMTAGVAVVGLVLAGCGEDGGSGRLQAVSISEGKGGGVELLDAMTAASEEAGSASFEITVEAQGMQISGEGAAETGSDPSEANMTATMELPGMGEMTMLLVDGQFYMSLPPEAGVPLDTPWLTIDPEGDDPMAEAFGQMLDEMSSSTTMQSDLRENAELIAVEEGGTDTVDGVEVTEYLLTIEPEDAQAFLESTGQPFGGAAPAEAITFSVWLDDDALLRKLTSDLAGVGSMEMRLFDFGEPVDVEAPPEDEVTDFSSLMGQGQ